MAVKYRDRDDDDSEDKQEEFHLNDLNKDNSDDDASFVRFVYAEKGYNNSEVYIWLDPRIITRMKSEVIRPKRKSIASTVNASNKVKTERTEDGENTQNNDTGNQIDLPIRIATLYLESGAEIRVLDATLEVGSSIARARNLLREEDNDGY